MPINAGLPLSGIEATQVYFNQRCALKAEISLITLADADILWAMPRIILGAQNLTLRNLLANTR